MICKLCFVSRGHRCIYMCDEWLCVIGCRLFEAVLHQTQMVLQKFAEGKVVHHRLEYEGATRLMDTVADHIDSVWVGVHAECLATMLGSISSRLLCCNTLLRRELAFSFGSSSSSGFSSSFSPGFITSASLSESSCSSFDKFYLTLHHMLNSQCQQWRPEILCLTEPVLTRQEEQQP